jgi:hypothetical protein
LCAISGEAMSIAAREFADDPCSSLKRGNMVRAARNLLSAVTRLLILADMVDVHLLLKSLRVVRLNFASNWFTFVCFMFVFSVTIMYVYDNERERLSPPHPSPFWKMVIRLTPNFIQQAVS